MARVSSGSFNHVYQNQSGDVCKDAQGRVQPCAVRVTKRAADNLTERADIQLQHDAHTTCPHYVGAVYNVQVSEELCRRMTTDPHRGCPTSPEQCSCSAIQQLKDVEENGDDFDAVQFFDNLRDALLCLHRHGILHKDIKWANVMLEQTSGEYRLVDFGLSTRIHDKTTMVDQWWLKAYLPVGTDFYFPDALQYLHHMIRIKQWMTTGPRALSLTDAMRTQHAQHVRNSFDTVLQNLDCFWIDWHSVCVMLRERFHFMRKRHKDWCASPKALIACGMAYLSKHVSEFKTGDAQQTLPADVQACQTRCDHYAREWLIFSKRAHALQNSMEHLLMKTDMDDDPLNEKIIINNTFTARLYPDRFVYFQEEEVERDTSLQIQAEIPWQHVTKIELLQQKPTSFVLRMQYHRPQSPPDSSYVVSIDFQLNERVEHELITKEQQFALWILLKSVHDAYVSGGG